MRTPHRGGFVTRNARRRVRGAFSCACPPQSSGSRTRRTNRPPSPVALLARATRAGLVLGTDELGLLVWRRRSKPAAALVAELREREVDLIFLIEKDPPPEIDSGLIPVWL